MSKPKPPEERDSLTIRPLLSEADLYRALANKTGVSLNAWCIAVLNEAAAAGKLVETQTSYRVIPPDEIPRAAEDPPARKQAR